MSIRFSIMSCIFFMGFGSSVLATELVETDNNTVQTVNATAVNTEALKTEAKVTKTEVEDLVAKDVKAEVKVEAVKEDEVEAEAGVEALKAAQVKAETNAEANKTEAKVDNLKADIKTKTNVSETKAEASDNTQSSPDKLLQASLNKVLEALSTDEKQDITAVFLLVNENLAQYFDFKSMARQVIGLGQYFRMTVSEQQAITDELQQMFLVGLADNLVKYQGKTVKFLPPTRWGRRVMVRALLFAADKLYPERLEFRFHYVDDTWKVYDMRINGESSLGFYRSHFQHKLYEQRIKSLIK